MRGTTPAFQQHVRAVDSDIRQMVEAIAVAVNNPGVTPPSYQDAVKKLNADFAAADSLTGLLNLGSPNDGVQLAETSTTILDHSTVTAGQYATQLNKNVAAFQCARIVLADSNSAQVELLSVTARLNPAQGGAQQVAFWNCQLFAAVDDAIGSPFGSFTPQGRATLVPICDPLQVAATNGTEGDVLFSWAGQAHKPRPKVQHPPAGFAGTGATPILYVMIWGTKADGTPAANCGWACETITGSGQFSQNNDTLFLIALTQTTAPTGAFGTPQQPLPGSSWWSYTLSGASAPNVPRLKLVYNTGTAATISWTGANKCDLGGAPAGAVVEFTGQGEQPAGSSIVYQVLKDDGTTWASFVDGQTIPPDPADKAPLTGITARQTYSVRATLNPSPQSDATPTLRQIGVRSLTRTDLSDVAEVQGGNVDIDPTTLKSSIAQATLVAIRDGDPDYRDAITNLLTSTPFGNLEFRVYRGSRTLARGDWLLQRTFLGNDTVCPGPHLELPLISPLTLVRGQLPVYNTGTGLRVPLKYAGFSIAAAFADIRDGQLGLPLRYRGAGPADTSVVGKLIPPNAQAVASSYAAIRSTLMRNLLDQQSWQTVQAKDELDNLAFLAGDAVIESQGRIKCVSMCEGSVVPANVVLFPRDLTNAAWTKTSCTPALDQPGAVDGVANAASSLVATGANATCLQVITVPSSARNQSAYVKRLVGTGEIDMTMDGGTTWRRIDAQLSSTVYTKISIASQTLASLSVGFRIVTNGDKIAVDLVDNDAGVMFALTAEALVASFNADEILWGRITPGFAQRIPEVFVPWNWNQAAQRLDFEHRAFNGPALLNLGVDRLDSTPILPTDLGQWITADGVDGNKNPTSTVAQRTALRQSTLLGGGLMLWEFLSTYEYPELEEGDLVAVPTAYFVAQNPITNAPISGWLMAIGKIAGTDLTGRRFRFWVRRWNDLIPSNVSVPRQNFANPVVTALQAFVDEAGEAWINAKCQDAKSLRVLASTSGMPTDTAVGAAAVNVLDANGQLGGFDSGVGGVPGQSLFVKAIAYENADGTGNASIAHTSTILFPKRIRSHLLSDNLYSLRATISDGSTAKSDAHNPQGSMLPNPSTLLVGNNMTYAGGGTANGHMWLSWAWLSGTLYRPDGSTIAVTGAGNIPNLGAPSLSQVSGGALGARTRFVRIALVKDHMLYMQSGNSEASLAISANNLLQVASPASQAGFDGWAVLVGSATNAEFTQPGVLTALPFGTAWTEPTAGATVSGTTPWNANWGGDGAHNAITAVELAATSTYLFYPTYDTQLANNNPGLGLLRMACALAGGPSTSTDPASAQLQVGDGRYAISYGSISGATPTANNTSSGNSGATTNVSTGKYL